MPDERDSILQQLIDRLFGDDVEVDVVMLHSTIPGLGPAVPRPPSRTRATYHAYLLGLEGETVMVMEMEVNANKSDGMRPPGEINIAYTKPPTHIKWTGQARSVCFDTITFKFHEQCDMGCCAWYYRTTPAFEEET